MSESQFKTWKQIQVPISEEVCEGVTNFLFELGAVGCYEKDDTLVGYFPEDAWSETSLKRLRQYLGSLEMLGFKAFPDSIEIITLKDRDWISAWRETFRPILVCEGMVVKPTWVKFDPPENTMLIEIDPQMAFGTGSHATTQMMLKLLKEVMNGLNGEMRVLDLGTGTGILAIAAAKSGAAQVVAVDIDPEAVLIARNNMMHNGVWHKTHLSVGTVNCIHQPGFDIILANINKRELLHILQPMAELLSPSGVIILSGILVEEESEILLALKATSLKVSQLETQEGWLALAVQRYLT